MSDLFFISDKNSLLKSVDGLICYEPNSTGPMPITQNGNQNPQKISFNSSKKQWVMISFILEGYRTVDGHHPASSPYEELSDKFEFLLNGQTGFSGYFDLGGGGNDEIFPIGQDAINRKFVYTFTHRLFRPQLETSIPNMMAISCICELQNGENTISLSYSTKKQQDTFDEAWGYRQFIVASVR